MRRPTRLAALVVIGLLATGCGGDDDTTSSPPPAADDQGAEPADDGGAGEAAGAGGTATVSVGGATRDFDTAESCSVDASDSVFVTFRDGGDMVNLTSGGGVVLVRMTLDGTDWVDRGSPPEPVVSGADATWTGEMSTGDATEDVTISISC